MVKDFLAPDLGPSAVCISRRAHGGRCRGTEIDSPLYTNL